MKRFLSILILALGLVVLTGCGTVTPAPVASEQASYDGGERNSGILDQNASGFIVTTRFRDRYNALVATYGRAWAPALTVDYGMYDRGDGTYLATREAMEKFLTMNAWRRMGREAAK